jgi:prepilin-type N-terminal cleavage/methylation domain-containing protein
VAIRPPKYNSQGYTLVEMLVVLIIFGIVMGFALPSLLTLNKPLRDGSLQFKSHLGLVRSKAISSNQAYRIKPRFGTRAAYSDARPHNFIVEYAANCKVPDPLPGAASSWQAASQFDLDLTPLVGITDSASTSVNIPGSGATSIDNSLNWSICFDNRGIVDTTRNVILQDFQGNNRAKIAAIVVGKVGSVDIYTYDASLTADLNDGQGIPNPVF